MALGIAVYAGVVVSELASRTSKHAGVVAQHERRRTGQTVGSVNLTGQTVASAGRTEVAEIAGVDCGYCVSGTHRQTGRMGTVGNGKHVGKSANGAVSGRSTGVAIGHARQTHSTQRIVAAGTGAQTLVQVQRQPRTATGAVEAITAAGQTGAAHAFIDVVGQQRTRAG